MRFSFSDDQRMFQSAVREMLEKECTPSQVRAGRVPGLWKRLADLGVAGLLVPKEHGGLGLDETDLVLVLEEAGRAALPEPLLETTAVAVPLLAEVGDDAWLPRIATGHVVATVALAGAPGAAFAVDAGVILVEKDGRIYAVPRDEATLEPLRSLDPARRVSAVSFDATGRTPLAGDEAIARALDRGAVAAAAQLLGIGSKVIEMASAYAKERTQFGKQIGEFQAVKHLLASAFVRMEFARPVVYRAAHSLATGAPDRSRDASMAKAFASEAASRACKAALQVHGAIGYTEEHNLHIWLRRGFSLASAWGDASWHRARAGDAIFA